MDGDIVPRFHAQPPPSFPRTPLDDLRDMIRLMSVTAPDRGLLAEPGWAGQAAARLSLDCCVQGGLRLAKP